MSYYFAIIGTLDNPLFEHEFGTSKQGGDGLSRFTDQARHLNQFILHSALDVVQEVQWTGVVPSSASSSSSFSASSTSISSSSASNVGGQMYLKVVDKFFNNYISCFITGANVKFLLLHQPAGSSVGAAGSSSSSIMSGTGTGLGGSGSRSSTSIAANPTSAATEEAIKNFFTEVYENWVKAIMSPFYKVNMEVRSPIFRQRVVAAGKKYL